MATTRIHQTWPLASLCLLASTLWLLLDRFPEITFTPASDALACALLTLITLAITRTQRLPYQLTRNDALGGAMLLAGPAAATLLHAPIDPGTLAIALTLTPVVIAVADSTITTELSAEALWPGLLAATGLLLVLPAPTLTNWRTDLVLLLNPILTGIGCVLFHRSPTPPAWKISTAATAATILFTLAALLEAATTQALPEFSIPAIAIDAILFTLTLLALTRLTPTQYTARYAIVPLAILLESPLLLHATITWRAALCALLLLVATIALLRSRSQNVHTEALEHHSP